MPWSFWVKHWCSTFCCGESLLERKTSESCISSTDLRESWLCHHWYLSTNASFTLSAAFPGGTDGTSPSLWLLGASGFKQHCGWNLISWSDTAKCLSAFAHKVQNNIEWILEVPNKRTITNTKHSNDIYFWKNKCYFSLVVKYLFAKCWGIHF